jgi:hypothetical protein
MNGENAKQRSTGTEAQPIPKAPPTEPNASMPSKDGGWADAPPTQVMRTVAIALLTAAVVLGAFVLLW